MRSAVGFGGGRRSCPRKAILAARIAAVHTAAVHTAAAPTAAAAQAAAACPAYVVRLQEYGPDVPPRVQRRGEAEELRRLAHSRTGMREQLGEDHGLVRLEELGLSARELLSR